MRTRLICLIPITVGLVIAPVSASHAATGSKQGVCAWGGTPANPSGTFTFEGHGLTNTPSEGPLPFIASGELSGGGACRGLLTFNGQMQPGATCAVQELEGTVTGLPGVVRFWGRGVAGAVHEFMYDSRGNVVGADQPQAFTAANIPRFGECNTPQGITNLNFSAVVELLGSG